MQHMRPYALVTGEQGYRALEVVAEIYRLCREERTISLAS